MNHSKSVFKSNLKPSCLQSHKQCALSDIQSHDLEPRSLKELSWVNEIMEE